MEKPKSKPKPKPKTQKKPQKDPSWLLSLLGSGSARKAGEAIKGRKAQIDRAVNPKKKPKPKPKTKKK